MRDVRHGHPALAIPPHLFPAADVSHMRTDNADRCAWILRARAAAALPTLLSLLSRSRWVHRLTLLFLCCLCVCWCARAVLVAARAAPVCCTHCHPSTRTTTCSTFRWMSGAASCSKSPSPQQHPQRNDTAGCSATCLRSTFHTNSIIFHSSFDLPRCACVHKPKLGRGDLQARAEKELLKK